MNPAAILTRYLLLSLACLAITACGGGGSSGGGGGGGGNNNAAPVADAGRDTNARPGFRVFLDGSESSDEDGSISSYSWTQLEGPAVTLINADEEVAQFTAPQVSATTRMGFRLRVTDDRGATASDTVAVNVEPPATASTFDVSGTLRGSPSQVVDGDVNNPAQSLRPNNSIETAQLITSPITVGGYVNEPGEGAEGASSTTGDENDYYRVELLEGQAVTMLVADFTEGRCGSLPPGHRGLRYR